MPNARIKLARDTARNIIKGANITSPPIILNDILQYLRTQREIEIRKSDLIEGFNGISAETFETAFVQYNENIHTHRIRSTVAHELGHICMSHRHPGNPDRFDIPKKLAEAEAWYFARELLMPLPMFRKDVKKLCDFQKLHTLYWISEDMLRVRLQELRLETEIWVWN